MLNIGQVLTRAVSPASPSAQPNPLEINDEVKITGTQETPEDYNTSRKPSAARKFSQDVVPNLSLDCIIPARGEIQTFTCNGSRIEVAPGRDRSVIITSALDAGIKRKGRLEVKTDCVDKHVIDKTIEVSTRLKEVGLSPGHLLVTPGVPVDYDDLLRCHRSRKAIIWPHVEGVALLEFRRGLDMVRALRIGSKITDAIRKMHSVGVSHGALSPLNLSVMEDSHIFIGDLHKAKINDRFGLITSQVIVDDIKSIFQILLDIYPGIYEMCTTPPCKDMSDKSVDILLNLFALQESTIRVAMNTPIDYDAIKRHFEILISLM
jgi:hypothetical protein